MGAGEREEGSVLLSVFLFVCFLSVAAWGDDPLFMTHTTHTLSLSLAVQRPAIMMAEELLLQTTCAPTTALYIMPLLECKLGSFSSSLANASMQLQGRSVVSARSPSRLVTGLPKVPWWLWRYSRKLSKTKLPSPKLLKP